MLIYKNLKLQFKNRSIFQGLDGKFLPGECVGILGPNGSGKSSFMKCLAGLQQPTDGRILLKGQPLESYSLPQLAKVRAYGRADIACAWNLTVSEILKLYPYQHAAPQDASIQKMLRKLDAAYLENQKFGHLSGGEKSLMVLALTLLQDTPLIFLDEITAMMDEKYAHMTLSILRELADQGKIIIIILHDHLLAKQYCHRLINFHHFPHK